MNPEMEVLCSSDMEGNNIGPLHVLTLAKYRKNKRDEFDSFGRNIELFDVEDNEEYAKGAKDCVVMWPNM